MEKLEISKSEEAPSIILDQSKGIFILSGKSYMEDVLTFFNPVIDWLQQYAKSPNDVTNFIFEVEYINTASSKKLLDILQLLEDIQTGGHKVTVEWHFYDEDEDMEEMGKEMEELYSLPFTFKPMGYDDSQNMFDVKTSF